MRINKKLAVIAATAGIVALGAGTAFAYWTTADGSGSDSGAAAASVSPFSVEAVDVPAGIVPGGSVTAVGDIFNRNATTSVWLGKVTPVVTTSNADCLPADFHISTVSPATRLVANGGVYHFSQVLSMDDTLLDQNACKTAAITVTLTASSS